MTLLISPVFICSNSVLHLKPPYHQHEISHVICALCFVFIVSNNGQPGQPAHTTAQENNVQLLHRTLATALSNDLF